MDAQRIYRLTDPSEVGVARRDAIELGRNLGMDQTTQGRVGVVVNELASNLLKHARGGELIVRPAEPRDGVGLELLALDRGPGIPDVARALSDGYSTAGSAGTGLGAVRRMATTFDLYSVPGAGTVVLARIFAGAPRATSFQVGVVSLPVQGETLCGDGWAVTGDDQRIAVLVVDGLGHGPAAALAAREAERIFHLHGGEGASDLLGRLHGALAHTRGAAAAIAEIDRRAGVLRFAGIGNISASLHLRGTSRSMVSQSGIVGSDVRRIQLFTYPFAPEAVLVAHSDGLSSHWQLDHALAAHDPAVIAAALYRAANRGRDDVTVLILRAPEVAP